MNMQTRTDKPANPKALFTDAEFAAISERSDARAWWLVGCNYAIVAATFAVMALWPNPLTVVLGTIVLGGRQLGFGVLTHECGHGTLFRTRRLNETVGVWLAAAPTFNNMHAYIRGHLHHHRLAGTDQDPDLPNYADYPITRDRLKRKLWRDLTGRTGWKQTRGLARGFANFARLDAEQRLALAQSERDAAELAAQDARARSISNEILAANRQAFEEQRAGARALGEQLRANVAEQRLLTVGAANVTCLVVILAALFSR